MSSRITQNLNSITAEVTRATKAEGTLSSSIKVEADRITAEVKRASDTEGNLSSRITVNANSISTEVTRAKGVEGNLSTSITVNANNIATKVSKNNIVSEINQSAEKIRNAESFYRQGNVNITPANIGLGNVNNTADANKNVSSALRLRSRGNVTAETEANFPAVTGLSMSQAYNNGYPTAYGNVLTLYGAGVSQLMLGWGDAVTKIKSLYYKNKRDVGGEQWDCA